MTTLELINKIADEAVNVTAIATIGYVATTTQLADVHAQIVVGGVVSIALGKHYLSKPK